MASYQTLNNPAYPPKLKVVDMVIGKPYRILAGRMVNSPWGETCLLEIQDGEQIRTIYLPQKISQSVKANSRQFLPAFNSAEDFVTHRGNFDLTFVQAGEGEDQGGESELMEEDEDDTQRKKKERKVVKRESIRKPTIVKDMEDHNDLDLAGSLGRKDNEIKEYGKQIEKLRKGVEKEKKSESEPKDKYNKLKEKDEDIGSLNEISQKRSSSAWKERNTHVGTDRYSPLEKYLGIRSRVNTPYDFVENVLSEYSLQKN
ncbi:hypothetical protein QAD02_013496 [Eretmocerus hayati]|uniref:Uncharacterized protein n=1 Tax=Eretmocerus hayati TaxID=131215 RepID=A0ACC2P2A6_9HYME|nr:hypothetical protein QAD02_013496 [Eretmocerus hayati]